MSAVVSEKPTETESIGLCLTTSSDQQENRGSQNNNTPSEITELTNQIVNDLKNGVLPTFIPPSVNPSPIPFDDNDDNNQGLALNETGPSSIMREPSHLDSQQQQSQRVSPKPDEAHVEALEERVRDLEEKLSTLSMLLQQQNQRHATNSPRTPLHHPSSPDSDSNGDDSSSMSSPATPFRSLASFATIPSSNVPVLESPTPVMSRRYRSKTNNTNDSSHRRNSQQDLLASFSMPYEHRSPEKTKRHRRGLSKNLSYHILHASDRDHLIDSAGGGGVSSDDGGNSSIEHQTDDSFERACQVPSLDSLPGSSRSSPILSRDPIVAGALSPIAKHQEDQQPLSSQAGSSSDSSVEKATNSSSSAAANAVENTNVETPQASETRDQSSSFSTIRRRRASSFSVTSTRNRSSSFSTRNRSGSISSKNHASGNNNSLSEISNGETKHKKKKSNIKSKWLDYLNSVQDSTYDTDLQMEGTNCKRQFCLERIRQIAFEVVLTSLF